jgi:hypothetical protein
MPLILIILVHNLTYYQLITKNCYLDIAILEYCCIFVSFFSPKKSATPNFIK